MRYRSHHRQEAIPVSNQKKIPPVVPRDSSDPARIGRYEILGTVGRGNMGNVYLARDPMIGRLVAIKTRRFDMVDEGKERDNFIDKFFEEARIAGNLIHPGIVTVFDVGRDGDQCFIAMELLEGESLASFTKPENL